jgi:hypothetical protein
MSTIDINLDLIIYLQHWYLISLVKLTFNPCSWKWFGQQLITCQQLTQIWLNQVFVTVAPNQPWKQNHIEIFCDWLYQNTVLALTQFLLYKDYAVSALRVWSECWFLRVWSWLSLESITEVWGPTCQWKIITWVTPKRSPLSLESLGCHPHQVDMG